MGVKNVLFHIPNIVGYARILLLLCALCTGSAHPWSTFCLFFVNFLLDFVDGWLARAFKQTSAFGTWLDVAVDNFSRAVLYAWTLPGPAAAFPISLEYLTFVATHKGGGAAWKTGYFSQAPPWVQSVMCNGFRTPPGILAIAGIMGTPLWLWAKAHLSASWLASSSLGAGLILGRLLALSVELWVLFRHLTDLVHEG